MATHQHDSDEEDQEEVMLDPTEAEEEIPSDEDVHMASDDEEDPDGEAQDEIHLHNDSIAHFDLHSDSIFCIAQNPKHPEIVATGGGDDLGYVWDASTPAQMIGSERQSIVALATLDGHTDSISAITFTASGTYLLTAGLDGRLRAYTSSTGRTWSFVAETQEVQEINFLIPCPHPSHPDTVALGAADGSVWIYTVSNDPTAPLSIVQAIYLHTGSCTAGTWTPDGTYLGTVSEDGSFYVHDVFGEATGTAIVSLTTADERFRVDGGLFSVVVSPGGTLAAVGGAEGHIRIVGLPKASGVAAGATGGSGAKGKASKAGQSTAGQAGALLASLQTQTDSVESLAFAPAPTTVLAAGSVDGSIVLFDAAKSFAVRRRIDGAHGGEAVIRLEFDASATLTSCGNDGELRRWDVRGGAAAADQGLVGEWKGHRGGGEGGGILGFVQHGAKIVTAGDDGVALVFDVTAKA